MNAKAKVLKEKGAPTPFQMIGRSVKKGLKGVGKVLAKEFVEPSRKVRDYNKSMDSLNKKNAKEGKFNRGEAYPESQSY